MDAGAGKLLQASRLIVSEGIEEERDFGENAVFVFAAALDGRRCAEPQFVKNCIICKRRCYRGKRRQYRGECNFHWDIPNRRCPIVPAPPLRRKGGSDLCTKDYNHDLAGNPRRHRSIIAALAGSSVGNLTSAPVHTGALSLEPGVPSRNLTRLDQNRSVAVQRRTSSFSLVSREA